MRQRFSLALLIWLFVVWVLLWGKLSPVVVLFGVIVAVATLLLFPLPTRSGVFARPLRLLMLVGYTVWDLLTSAVGASWEVLRYGRKTASAVFAVPILAEADHVVVASANLVSLTPDTFVLQIDRRSGIFYVYLLGARSDGDVASAYHQVVELQVRVLRALGGADEIRDLRERADRAHRARKENPATTASSSPPSSSESFEEEP
ncbi:multisubunit sodium/proton antiporter, MrpE subunit [Amycolatopsis marina]|uniref:Multisubunit sodium/proton antiporter, MrpE subunit n=1 Tax=Amycolatopsis marina TaxID=490629 RepID=A0A1I0ZCH2_9PSEU|nr:Na+/H+ antiporter subunit E [Amycolatopsis marina]SFB23325.1 multisubunit sodium/proton antiporter, MrpE subunit [Amycolatopsis marina]